MVEADAISDLADIFVRYAMKVTSGLKNILLVPFIWFVGLPEYIKLIVFIILILLSIVLLLYFRKKSEFILVTY